MRCRLVHGMLLLACSGCGSGDEEETFTITDQILQGNVQGQSWQFVSGYAKEGYEEGELRIQLHAVEAEGGDPCAPGAYAPEGRAVGLTIVPEPQDEEFSFDNAGTFSFYEDGTLNIDVILSGRLIIEEVSEDAISGAMLGSTAESEVDGHFSVPICLEE